MQRFLAYVEPWQTVLDVGGNPAIWKLVPQDRLPRIVYLNMPRAHEPEDDTARLVFGDGCRLPFGDQSFDWVFSNSVIEHVGSAERQAAFAAEVRRVGRRYWVQTPNRWFPVEQHLLTPLIHWAPKSWQRWLVPRFTVWALLSHADPAERRFYFDHFLDDIRLLSANEFVGLFPDGKLKRERVLRWTKSLIVFR